MSALYNTILFQPLLNLLIFLYSLVGDIGIAIIILTIIIKLLLLPLSHQSIKGQRALQELQPKLDEIKKKYKDNKEAQARAMMELYKTEKINPLGSCLPLLIQLPFLIAVYQVFIKGLDSSRLELLYPFVANPGTVNTVMFGALDLNQPHVFLAVLAAAAQYWQAKMLMVKRPPKNMPGAKDEDMAAIMNKQMMYFMPAITLFIGMSLPGGLVLYWFVVTLLTALQQKFLFRKPATAEVEVIGTGSSNTPPPAPDKK